jgi:hypothetical protein
MMWVEKRTVLPSARHWRINWMIARAAMTSRPEVASSKTMTSGSWMIVRAIEIFCCMPVESLPTRRSAKASMPSEANRASRRRR